MSAKTKRNISLAMVILGVIALIGLAISRAFFDAPHDTWQYIAAPLCICFFGILYRNYSQAVKEEEKYGPTK